MIEKEKSDSEENRDLMEVEFMNTWSRQREVRNSDAGEQAPENPVTAEDHATKESHSFGYDFIDHL